MPLVVLPHLMYSPSLLPIPVNDSDPGLLKILQNQTEFLTPGPLPDWTLQPREEVQEAGDQWWELRCCWTDSGQGLRRMPPALDFLVILLKTLVLDLRQQDPGGRPEAGRDGCQSVANLAKACH